VPEGKAIHVYRVLQEALSNVARHSHASAATVRLTNGDGSLGLEVEDDGIGIAASRGRGLGLVAMQERAELVQGYFEVKNSARGGTLIKLKIPLEESEE
jgi:signal transduction histidine kinase